MLKKLLAVAIIVLFVGASVTPSISGNIGEVINVLDVDVIVDIGEQECFSGNQPKEEWNKTYGGVGEDWCYDVQQTNDGGYILVGYTTSQGSGNADIWLLKTDTNGTMEWNKTFGGFTTDKGYSVQQTIDGGFILVGKTFSYGYGSCDAWLIKIDQNGNEQWNKTYGNVQVDAGSSVRQTSDSGYIITGYTESYGHGDLDVWLIKTNESGVELWNHTYGSSYNDGGNSVEKTPDGGYIITGYINGGYSGHDVCLIKTDENGTEEWNQTWDNPGNDFGACVKVTKEGGYIISGYKSDYPDLPDAWLIKTDENGTMEWNKTFGGNGFDWAESVYQTSYGGYILTGLTTNKSGLDRDLLLIETDRDGNKIWNITIGTKENGEMGYSVQQTIDGGYAIAGYTYSYGAGKSDFWLIKIEHFNYPPSAPTITGPQFGDVGVEYEYTFVANDFEENDIYYYVDWSDGTHDDWFGPYPSGEEATATHAWDLGGDYHITAKAKDTHDVEGKWSDPYPVRIGNQAPDAPTITGETNGEFGVEYEYTFNATDPEGDNVSYWIEWFEDDPSAKWEGPYASGEEITFNHIWYEKGKYTIRAKVKDIWGYESGWGTLEVTMPKNKPFTFNYPLLNWLFERFPNAFPILRHMLGL